MGLWRFGSLGCSGWVTMMRGWKLLLASLALFAQPVAAASSPSLSGLEQELQSLVANKSADVGIAALDLDTGETLSVKGNTPFPMASTVKVAVAALYLSQVDHGMRSLDDTVGGQPVRKVMAKMLIYSDNHSADLLFKAVGGPTAVHDWLRDNGIEGVHVNRNIAQLLSSRRVASVRRFPKSAGPPLWGFFAISC